MALRHAIAGEIKAQGREGKVEVCGTGCMGLCSQGPLVMSAADHKLYGNVTAADAAALVSANPIDRTGLAPRAIDLEAPFFTRQTRIVLANSGKVDPERLTDYIAAGGYQALATVINEKTPKETVDEVKKSGLRGRGGAGYPTGLKWELVAKQTAPVKYVVCNADEGDPGAFMDRSVLEGDPHRVLEGMAIAGYAVGAQQGYIYVRGEYGLAIQRLQTAIKQAERERLLGSRILEQGFQFRDRPAHRRGRVRLRRRDGADRVDRRQARPAAAASAVPAGIGTVGRADADQQRRDVRQHPADHRARRRSGSLHRDGEQQGDQGVRAGRQDREHRTDRGADGDDPARDPVRYRRRHPGRASSKPRRPADLRAAASRRSFWTCRWITSRWRGSARSWGRAG